MGQGPLAVEPAAHGIRVNAVLPGYARTSMLDPQELESFADGAAPLETPARCRP